MSRNDVFIGLYQTLVDDPLLVPGILGPRTATNQRIYRVFPQVASLLSNYEPQPDGEGWLVIEEPQPGMRSAAVQYDTATEMIEVNFHVFATRYAVADAAIDVLDSYLEWTTEQMRDVIYGDRILLFTRRFECQEKYAAEIKMVQKIAQFRLRTIRTVLFP